MDREEAEREQAERREYVKNLGIEYRFGCYEVSEWMNELYLMEVEDTMRLLSGETCWFMSSSRRIYGGIGTEYERSIHSVSSELSPEGIL